MRQWLFAAHARHGLHRDTGGLSGLFDRTDQQGVRSGLAEHPVTVFQGRLDSHREPHRLPEVVDPVIGVEGRLRPRVIQGGRVVRHLGFLWNQFCEFGGQVGENRVDLRRVRGHVHGHLAGHHIDGFPGGYQFPNRIGRAADDGGFRRGEHRHHDISDSAGSQFVAHLRCGQLDRGHRSAAGQPAHEPRTAADHSHSVRQGQRAGDDGCRCLAHGMSDDRPRLHAVGPHRRRERNLHGEQRRLNPVDSGHRLRCRHCLGHREPGFACDQRLEFGDVGGEHRLSGQEFRAHRRPLRTLAGEHPHRSAVALANRFRVGHTAVGDLPQAADQSREVGREHRGAHRPVPAPTGQRVGQIGGRQAVRVLLDPVGQPPCGAVQLLGRGRRDREQQ